MENNKPKKDYLNIVLYILIGIIIILCVLLVIKIIDARKVVDKKEEKEVETVIVVRDDEVIPNQQEDEKKPEEPTNDQEKTIRKEYLLDSSEKSDKLEKVYDDKPLIYTAEYKYESDNAIVEPENYNNAFVAVDTTGKSGIKVPYINIKSNNAIKANLVLKEKYISAMDTLDNRVKCVAEYETTHVPCTGVYLNYSLFESKNIVSVVVYDAYHSTDIPHPQYVTYSFDKTTGNYLGIKEIAKKENLTVDELKEKTKDLITTKIDELDLENSDFEKPFGTYKDDTIKNFEDGFDNYEYICEVRNTHLCYHGVQYYYDNEEKLHALVPIHMQFGIGREYRNIEVK